MASGMSGEVWDLTGRPGRAYRATSSIVGHFMTNAAAVLEVVVGNISNQVTLIYPSLGYVIGIACTVLLTFVAWRWAQRALR